MYKLITISVLLCATFAQKNDDDLISILDLVFGPMLNTITGGQNTGGPAQNTGSTGQSTSGPAQDTNSTGQNTGGTGQHVGGLVQNTDSTGQNTGGAGQNTGGPAQNIRSTGQNTGVAGQNTGGPAQNIRSTGQNTGGTGQHVGGLVQNTDSTGQNISGTGQNTDSPVQKTDGSNQNTTQFAPPTGVSDDMNTSCVTSENEMGECVHYYLCDQNTDDEGVIDIHIPEPCSSYLDVCCPNSRMVTVTATASSNTTLMMKREGCGYRNPGGVDSRITRVADDEIKLGEFPWIVAILKMEPDNQKTSYVGSGSLIHPSVVLTAAHVAESRPLRVRAGEWDAQSETEMYPYQERDVAKIEIHRDYNRGTLYYDIALLFLATPLEPAPNVGVVCLPPPREDVQGGTRCVTSGWGRDKFGKEGRLKAVINKVELPIVERRSCLDSLRSTRLGGLFELHTSFLCAGGDAGQDTCKRDGGSPLVCPIEFEEDRYMQSGIAAWSIGCGDTTPGVFVNVAKLRPWIDDKVKGQGYGITGYSYTV